MESFATEILITLMTAITGGLAIFFSETIKKMYSSLLFRIGQFKEMKNVNGRWEGVYSYVEAGEVKKWNEIIVIKQSGKYINGRNESDTSFKYSFKGRIKSNTYLTGTWEEGGSKSTDSGTLHLKINVKGVSMKGKWTGLRDDTGEVLVGDWNLTSKP